MVALSRKDYSKLTGLEIKNKLSISEHETETEENVPAAAVLIPLFRKNQQWHVLFMHRSQWVNNHKGQVSFPGGMAEERDQNVVATALRETREELGITASEINVLGQLSPLVFRKEYKIYPIVGEIPWPIKLIPSAVEVSHTFSIPLDWLANPSHFALKDYPAPDGQIRQVYFFQKYRGELLWGISAFITVELVGKLN